MKRFTYLLLLKFGAGILGGKSKVPKERGKFSVYLTIPVCFLLFSGSIYAQNFNPFAPAKDFGVFVEQNMTVYGKENKTNLAVGGNLILKDGASYKAGSNGIGTYKVPGDDYVTSVYIGGTIVATNYLKVQGTSYIKIKNTTGLTCKDVGNNLEIYSGNNLVASTTSGENCGQVSNMGPLNISTAFTEMRGYNNCLAAKADNVTLSSSGFIDCKNAINFIHLTTSQLNSNIKITTNADASHVLVVNIDGGGQPFHMNSTFDSKTDPQYSMWNITNMPAIYFDGLGSNLKFSILAPNTNGYLDEKEMHGQIVFKNLNQTDKHYIHPYNFKGKVNCGSTPPLPPGASLGSIGNFVWYDADKDGIQDSGEPGIKDVIVTITGAGGFTESVTTDANGMYQFTNLPAGTYTVKFTTPSGYTATGANQGGNDEKDSDPVAGSVTVTLTSGQINNSIDAGYCGNTNNAKGAIGDFVFYDANGNGIQDAGEAGLPGVSITIKGENNYTSSMVSGANGAYKFENLPAGKYTLTFKTPTGYSAAHPNMGNDDTKDSDPVNGSVTVTLISGQINNTIDAGFCGNTNTSTGVIGNFVWYDADKDGIQDSGEPGIKDVIVTITGAGGFTKSVTTDANGMYQFTNLPAGTYTVKFTTPSGYTATGANQGGNDEKDSDAVSGSVTVTLTSGQTNNTIDAGFCGNVNNSKGVIGDFVFYDANGNGIQEAGETGLPGVSITIKGEDNYTSSTVSGADGSYKFDNLPAGKYTLTFKTPTGYTEAHPNRGGDDTKDSDPVDGSVKVTLGQNEINLTVDAGFCKPVVANLSLGNQVWNDRDGDGKRDPSEPAIPGATISLYTDNNSDNLPDGAAIRTTTTSAQGMYKFTGLLPGRYIASMPILPGYQQTPNTSTQATSPFPDNNVEDDNNLVRLVGANGPGGIVFSNAITLTSGQETEDNGNTNNTFDLAQCGNSFIGDFVFNDLNGNGVQDAFEPGIDGVLVTITFPDGRTATELTHTYVGTNNQNAPQYAGYYDFENLGPGTYKITFTTPAGLRPSPSNQGGNDAKDSDAVNGSATVTIEANQSDFTIDAGFTNAAPPPPPVTCPNLSVGNMVFYDANGNGVKDAAEAGIAGLTVKLYADNDGNNLPDGNAISTLMTAADGTYYFGNIAAGKYIVGVTTGTGYMQGANGNANANDNKDNDNNGISTVNGEVRSNSISLSAGDEPINDGSDNNSNLTLDFGLKMGATPCEDHCTCKNDCTHNDCGHKNCKKDKTDNDKKEAKTEVSVFPNPITNYFTLKVDAAQSGPAQIRITDGSGHLVMAKNINLTSGANTITFNDLSNLNSGKYNVQLLFNYQVFNQQIVLVK